MWQEVNSMENKESKTFIIQVTENAEGQSVIVPVYSCKIGEEKVTCEREAKAIGDLLRNALSSPRGVLVMPRVIEESKVESLKKESPAKESSKKKITEKKE